MVTFNIQITTLKKLKVTIPPAHLINTSVNAIIENKWNYVVVSVYNYPQKSYSAFHNSVALEEAGPNLNGSVYYYVNIIIL